MNQEQCDRVNILCTGIARSDRFEAITKGLGITVAIGVMITLGIFVAEVASAFFGAFFVCFAGEISMSLELLLTDFGALAGFLSVGFAAAVGVKRLMAVTLPVIEEQWAKGTHYYSQAADAFVHDGGFEAIIAEKV